MRFLITGAAGFIGSHLADRLLIAGNTILGVDNFETGSKANFPIHLNAKLHELDITNRSELYALANTFLPDVVIHCAASYSDPNKWHRDTDTNIAGTINVVNLAKFHNARLLYFQTALPPISSYAISKIAGGQYIGLSGVDSLTFRLSNIYGPRNLSGPIPTFYKRLTNGQPCTVTDTQRDMVYIDDLVHAVLKAIGKPEVSGTLDICSGTHRPISELYDAVAGRVCGEFPPKADLVPRPEDDVAQMELSNSHAFSDLDWTPVVDLNEGTGKAVDWYAKHGVGETFTHLALKG